MKYRFNNSILWGIIIQSILMKIRFFNQNNENKINSNNSLLKGKNLFDRNGQCKTSKNNFSDLDVIHHTSFHWHFPITIPTSFSNGTTHLNILITSYTCGLDEIWPFLAVIDYTIINYHNETDHWSQDWTNFPGKVIQFTWQ